MADNFIRQVQIRHLQMGIFLFLVTVTMPFTTKRASIQEKELRSIFTGDRK